MPESPVPPSVSAFLPADLPSPLKAIAGIAVTMVHDVKHLPERAIQLPGSVITHLAAKSLRVQQQYAEWVARGEEFLGSLQEPSEEIPPWATFDEDLPAPEPAQDDDLPAPLGLGPGSAFDLQAEDDLPVARRRTPPAPIGRAEAATEAEPTKKAPAKKSTPAKKSAPVKKSAPAKKAAPVKKNSPAEKAAPATKDAPAKTAGAKKAAAKKTTAKKTIPAAKAAPAENPAPNRQTPNPAPIGAPEPDMLTTPGSDAPAATTPTMAAPASPSPAAITPAAAPPPAGDTSPDAPQSLPDFDTLTIPQLRTRLKTLRTPEIEELIAYERDGRNRPAIVGMLRARLETLQK